MLGGIFGDIVGSVYEFKEEKPDYNFTLVNKLNHFTDDTVLMVALADSIINNKPFPEKMREYYFNYPRLTYGGSFHKWANSINMKGYNSWGNGSAMRVAPVGFYYNSLDEVLQKAEDSASVTHNHIEGIKGAKAAAGAIYLARTTKNKKNILEFIKRKIGYDINLEYDELVTNYKFDESCQGTVPQAIYTFLISENFEDSIRKAITIGGDSDTLACINGGIAEAFYGIPEKFKKNVYSKLDQKLTEIVNEFYSRI